MSVKDKLLGQSFGSANNRLRKLILWTLVCQTDRNVCFRCGQRIEDIDDLSIEHKEPWQSADDPKAAFYDLGNIAFSHTHCNYGAAKREKDQCSNGHPYTVENTYRYPGHGSRRCRKCQQNLRKSHQRSGSTLGKRVH